MAEATQETAGGAEPSGPRLLVVALHGPLRSYPLAGIASVRIGRDETGDVIVDDPKVSREHALLTLGPQPSLEDRSRHGTWVDGERIPSRKVVPISPTCVFRVGNTLCFLQTGAREATADGPSARIVVSRQIEELRQLVRRVARTSLRILFVGESGVGKELFAEEAHEASERTTGPFVRVNCAAIAPTLFESELFGHERGAFTGAHAAKAGYFESAHGGTLFLDEIGELPIELQPKLLRVLETQTVVRVGSTTPRSIDARVISATNRSLEEMVAAGRFREDLLYRLNGVVVRIPPLRDRPEEILPLARQAAARACVEHGATAKSIGASAAVALQAYPWPGNVRELRNVMERAVAIARGNVIEPADLMLPEARAPRGASAGSRRVVDDGAPLEAELESVERRRIAAALEKCAGNQKEAAALLGISRRTLVYRLGKLGFARPRKRS